MRYHSVVLSIGLILAAWACTPRGLETYEAKDREETLIVSALMRIPDGIKGRSVEMIMQPYAEDLYLGNFQNYIGVAGPTAPLSLSKEDLRAAYVELLKSSKNISMKVMDFQLTVSGNRATAEARTELVLKIDAPKREERQQVFANEVLWRLRRTPAGWKIVEEIWR